MQVTKDFLASHEVQASGISWGATGVKVPELVDAIVDLTETGSSLRANKLRIVDILMETNTVLIAQGCMGKSEKRGKRSKYCLIFRCCFAGGWQGWFKTQWKDQNLRKP